MNDRIYLIGFMGSGKSYIGKLLAQALDYRFVDLDEYIVQISSFPNIPQIFEQKGEAYFRQLERQALKDSQNWDKVVIATGGGSPCQKDNMQKINAFGFSVFLDPPLDILVERLLPERLHRPLIANLGESELKEFVVDLLKKRRPFYEQANVRIRAFEKEEIIDKISAYLKY
jgi:shikimate kinase